MRIQGLSRHFGSVVALDNFNLEVEKGELVALLGPSGCGKTTALRIVAGLENHDSGSILLNGEDLTQKPAHERNMGMVFQAYSLFPNMSVLENVGFGLQMRKHSKSSREKKALELLELVGLPTQASRFPHQLSGGQQQRVALARALAFQPEVLLLDEPLSALDAQVRSRIREEIRAIQLELGITTLFVTHDQEEAMAISDRVGVMNKGRLEQIDKPIELYNNPATPFVASFVGLANKIPATITGKGNVKVLQQKISLSKFSEDLDDTSLVHAIVRPESIVLTSENEIDATQGLLISKSFLGPLTKLGVAVEGLPIIHIHVSSKDVKKLEIGDRLSFKINAEEIMAQNV
jgi:putative spermidine/putrescine transport system ATP-binding protein